MASISKIESLDPGLVAQLEKVYHALPASRQSIFNDPAFLVTCWQVFAKEHAPFALVQMEGDEPVGAAMFRHDTVKIGGRLRPLVVPLVFKCSEFTPFLVLPGKEDAFFGGVVRYFLNERTATFLPRLREDDLPRLPANDRRVMRYGETVNPVCIDDDSAFAENINKKSLRRRTNWFTRNGELTVEHFEDVPIDRLRHLVDLHIERWAEDGIESKFTNPEIVSLYERLASTYSSQKDGANRMILTDIRFDGVSIAMHVGFAWQGTFLYQVPATNIRFQDRWPGEVLMRALFEYAREKRYEVFDLGFGGEWYKDRYANASYTYHNVLLESSATAAMTLSALTSLKKPFGRLREMIAGETS